MRDRAPRFRVGRQPDVWLADGHSHPPETGGAPLVVVIHEASWADPDLAHFLHPDFARVMADTTQASVDAASAILTCAESSRQQIARVHGADPTRIHVVPYGVDLDAFNPDAPPAWKGVTPPAWGSAPFVLFVGVLHPRKNLAGLRRAMTQLADAGRPHRLVIVGSPARDRPDPQQLVAEYTAELPGHPGRVHVVEQPSDAELAGLYASAAAFCLPSWWEGFGFPALEALACGTTVVASDRGSLPEVVGDAGILVSPEADSIRAGLERALDDPVPPATARRRAETMPWSRTVDGWDAVLQAAARV